MIATLFTGTSTAQILPNLGGQRAGISTLTFLKNDASPRSLALGGANLALDADGMSTSHNPAVNAQLDQTHFAFSDLMLGATIHQGWVSGVVPLNSSTSALGLNFNYFSSGSMKVRTEFQPNGNGTYFNSNQFAVGLSYAKMLSNRFSFGANLKYVRERLAQYTNNTVAADLGFLYTTDVHDLKFGIVVSNFGGNSALSGDFLAVDFNRSTPSLDKFSVPTTFRLGASIKAIEKENQSLLAAIQLEHPNDNSENLRLGLEYEYRKMIFVRIGYKLNVKSEILPTFGAGYRTRLGSHTVNINYAANATSYLGIIHSLGLDIGINKRERE